MAKLFDADGKEVEAFTPEELEVKKKEALDEYLKEHPDQSAEMQTAKTALEEAQKKLKDLEGSGNDEQKKRLIAERDEAEKKLKETTEGLVTEMKNLKDSFFGSAKEKIIKKLAGDDVELRKKIELEYDGFAGEAKNETEIQERLTKAYTIVNGTAPAPNFMEGMGHAGKRGVDQNHNSAQPESENSKNMRKALGISDEQVKKYGPDAANT